MKILEILTWVAIVNLMLFCGLPREMPRPSWWAIPTIVSCIPLFGAYYISLLFSDEE